MIIVFDKPTALNPTGSSSPDYVPLIPPRAHASHLFPFTLPRPSHGGQSPAGLRFLASMSNAGSQALHLGFVQLGNLLEVERTILPLLDVFAGAFQAGGTFGKRAFISTLLGVGGKQSVEDFGVPEVFRCQAGRGLALCAVGCPKAALRKGTVCREGLRRNFSSARLLSDSREMLLAELWGAWLLAHRSRRCWTGRTGCVGVWWAPCTACGHISTAWHSSGGMSWAGCGALCSCSPGRYRHPRRVMGWTLITAVCRLLCGGDTPLLARVILDGGKITSEFCLSSPVLWCSPAQDKAAPGSLCLSLSLAL